MRWLALATILGSTGCNFILGVDDHEPVPENCGVASLEEANAGFLDVRTGHCYSVVTHSEPANHDFASNACVASGGYLACVTDKVEFDLLNQKVVPWVWLGMRFEGGEPAGCDNGESFDVRLPIWQGATPGDAGCTALDAASVIDVGCSDDTHDSWLCEFELGEGS